MVSRIIPIRLKDQELRQIDRLVEYGIFQSRSEAIRELLRLGVENLSYISEISKALKKISELEKVEGRIPIDLSGATKQLLKERER
ncbi:MAG: ribbon-helix-helix domain-containing protein [Thermoproteota archaeon]